jgi:cell pole-organizing protein PopZ
MADAKDQHEPSMEEILASIRRIISEDGTEGAPAAAPAGAAAARGDDDVLVLTEEVDSEGEPLRAGEAEPEPEPAPLPEPPPPPVNEDLGNEPSVTLSEPELAPAEPEPAPASPTAEFGRRLISDTTAAASLSALSELVSRTHREPNIQSMPLGNAQRTLEDITRELLRPILKDWLDDNLPELVERIVREEIGRLALDAQRR